jgi:hypothetical protein
MDLLLVWKPWWQSATPSKWIPKTEGLHVDQNPLQKPGFMCVQGMVPLFDVTAATGGLEVVPRSHLPAAKEKLVAQLGEKQLSGLGDFCRMPPGLYSAEDSLLVEAAAGDLILWDSRTVHGGLVGTGPVQLTHRAETFSDAADAGAGAADAAGAAHAATVGGTHELARLSCTVAMVPRSRAPPSVLQARVAGFKAGRTFNHAPHEAGTSSGTIAFKAREGYVPVELSPNELAVL